MASRSRWIAVVVSGCAAAIALAFMAGLFVRSDQEVAIKNSRAIPHVVVTVEQRSFPVERPVLEGAVSTGQLFQVNATSSETASVVTSSDVEPGDTVTSGTVLGRVSGRPVIALYLPFKLYRDINPGDQGDDVSALQRSLSDLTLYSGPIDGVYGPEVEASIRKLYTDRSLLPPIDDQGETPVWYGEIFAMPTASTVVETISPLGTSLEGQPLAQLRSGNTTITARVPSSLRESFSQGTPVEIDSGSDLIQGTITEVSEFRGADSDTRTGIPGFDAVISVDDDDALVDGAIVSVQTRTTGADEVGLALPVTAIRQDGDKTYVILDDSNKTRIDVEVKRTFQGWALISSTKLSTGDHVLVSSQS